MSQIAHWLAEWTAPFRDGTRCRFLRGEGDVPRRVWDRCATGAGFVICWMLDGSRVRVSPITPNPKAQP
jgi:hypothetical protein